MVYSREMHSLWTGPIHANPIKIVPRDGVFGTKGLIVLACQLRMTTQYGNVRPVHPEALSRVDTTVAHLGSLPREVLKVSAADAPFRQTAIDRRVPQKLPVRIDDTGVDG